MIERVMEGMEWPALAVNFDQPTWRIDSDAVDVDHYSIIVLLDQPSQVLLTVSYAVYVMYHYPLPWMHVLY